MEEYLQNILAYRLLNVGYGGIEEDLLGYGSLLQRRYFRRAGIDSDAPR